LGDITNKVKSNVNVRPDRYPEFRIFGVIPDRFAVSKQVLSDPFAGRSGERQLIETHHGFPASAG